jgi:hypothetical protein
VKRLIIPLSVVLCVVLSGCQSKPASEPGERASLARQKTLEQMMGPSAEPKQVPSAEQERVPSVEQERVPSVAPDAPQVVQGPSAPKSERKTPPLPEKSVRPSALAGSWYVSDPDALKELISELLDRAVGRPSKGYPMALLVPHAGYRYSGLTAAEGYRLLKGRTYGRVFLLGTAHRQAFSGISVPPYTHYRTPLGEVPLDLVTCARLKEQAPFVSERTAHTREHSIEIHLPFLQMVLGDFQLVPLLVSHLTPQELDRAAELLRAEIGPGDIVIASSDFTHYGPNFGYLGPPDSPFQPDQAPGRLAGMMETAWGLIAAGDVPGLLEYKEHTKDTICGLMPIALLLKSLPPGSVPDLLATDTSGNLTRDYLNSVSYLSAVFYGHWPYSRVEGMGTLAVEEREVLLGIARETVERFVRTGDRTAVSDVEQRVTAGMREHRGVFVTLKKDGSLRGCIGTILPAKSLIQAILDNAVNAAAFDGRFQPVTEDELDGLTVEISVLSPPVEIGDYQTIVLGRDGIILEKNGRSSVFLPQVAVEQGWDLVQTLTHLSGKAGLGPTGWNSGAVFKTFQALVFAEKE